MTLPFMLTRPCYCGTGRDGHGMCPHCDLRQADNHSATPCAPCDRLARRCSACGTIYGTPAAATTCERSDRAQETRRQF